MLWILKCETSYWSNELPLGKAFCSNLRDVEGCKLCVPHGVDAQIGSEIKSNPLVL